MQEQQSSPAQSSFFAMWGMSDLTAIGLKRLVDPEWKISFCTREMYPMVGKLFWIVLLAPY